MADIVKVVIHDPVNDVDISISPEGAIATTLDNVAGTQINPATEDTLDAIKTAVEILDNAISGSEMQVDIVSGSVGVTGTVTVAASQLDIDNLNATDDVVTVTGGAGQTADVKVTLDSETVTVDGSGVTQPVSGTVTANLGSTDNAVIDQIETNTSFGDNTGGGTESGALRVTIANDSSGVLSVDDNGGSITVDNAGTFAVQSALQTGSNVVGDVGISGARTSGGTTIYKNIDIDESEEQIKGTAGQVYWIHAVNVGSAVRYLKFYNATAASVTVGTTVPDLTFPIPTQGDGNGAGFTLSIPNGIAFSTAITVAATTGVADNDSGAPGANEVILNLGYA